jgi:hypothetical protein
MRAELPRIRRLLGEDPGQLHPVEGALTMS